MLLLAPFPTLLFFLGKAPAGFSQAKHTQKKSAAIISYMYQYFIVHCDRDKKILKIVLV